MDRNKFDEMMRKSIDVLNKGADKAIAEAKSGGAGGSGMVYTDSQLNDLIKEVEQEFGKVIPPKITADQIQSTGMQFGFDVAEVQRVNLGPGDVLMVTVKNDDLTQESVNGLRYQLENVFPNNKVFVFAMGTSDDVKITVASQSETSYCSDCNCGKKEAAETEDEHIKNLAKQAENT